MFKHRGSRREEEDYHHWHPRERIKSEEHLKRKIHRHVKMRYDSKGRRIQDTYETEFEDIHREEERENYQGTSSFFKRARNDCRLGKRTKFNLSQAGEHHSNFQSFGYRDRDHSYLEQSGVESSNSGTPQTENYFADESRFNSEKFLESIDDESSPQMQIFFQKPYSRGNHVNFLTPSPMHPPPHPRREYRRTPYPFSKMQSEDSYSTPMNDKFSTPTIEEESDESAFDFSSCQRHQDSTKSLHFTSERPFFNQTASFVDTPGMDGLMNAFNQKKTRKDASFAQQFPTPQVDKFNRSYLKANWNQSRYEPTILRYFEGLNVTQIADYGSHQVVTATLKCQKVWESEEAAVAMEVIILTGARYSLKAKVGRQTAHLNSGSNVYIKQGTRFMFDNRGFGSDCEMKILLFNQ